MARSSPIMMVGKSASQISSARAHALGDGRGGGEIEHDQIGLHSPGDIADLVSCPSARAEAPVASQ
jgi:hypothetical protein